jgi:transcriptional regulator with XRE-family HTH domain
MSRRILDAITLPSGPVCFKVLLKTGMDAQKAKALAAWLKGARKDKGLSQDALAEKVGVSGVRIYQWEKAPLDSKGEPSYPPLDKLVALAKALGRDVREPLKVLGVLKDETIEITPDEREALAFLRTMREDVNGVALNILSALAQLQAGKATRKGKGKRGATGYNEESKKAS